MSRKQWGHGNVYLRGKTWWIYYGDHGRMIRESAKTEDRKKAENLLKQRLASVARGEDLTGASTRVDDLLDELLRDYERNDKSVAWAKIVVNHLRPHFGRHVAAKVGTVQVNAYIDARRRKKIKNGTINRELALLRSAFYMGLRADPPMVQRVPHIPKLREADARKGFFETSDFAQLCRHLPPDIRDVAHFARQTGCRKSEILKIQWSQVDFGHRVVRLESGETKNDEARLLPMTTAIYEILWRRKRDRDRRWSDSPWVFSRHGQRIKSFKTVWASACEAAKLGRKSARLFHDLRRTGVRNMIRAGVPEKVAMRISGHKTRSVFDRYCIIDERDLADAARKMDKLNEQEAV